MELTNESKKTDKYFMITKKIRLKEHSKKIKYNDEVCLSRSREDYTNYSY